MNRRNFLSQSALLTAATLAAPGLALAAEKKAPHDHAASGNALLDAAVDCSKKADLCLQHCMESLSSGSTMMAECAASVREMKIYCDALAKAAAQKSKHLKAIAKIAEKACKDCETQCRKHEKMDVCRACADACAACAKECASA